MKGISAIFILVICLTISLVQGLGTEQSGQSTTCRQPTDLTINHCRQMEASLLRATVQVVAQSWRVTPAESGYEIRESVGHATVEDGRYLVTHNHFSTLGALQLAPAESEAYIRILLYDADGEFLLAAPLTDFAVVAKEAEILVLEMKKEADRETFASRGVASGCFERGHSLFLTPGIEVARIDWDGAKTTVDWVLVQKVVTVNGVPCLLLAGEVTPGASGGGVFWNGFHVATNWALVEHFDENGMIVQRFTIAVLDSEEVLVSSRQ